ncbi:MAG: dehydrogenase/reductase SDR family protein 7B, partial [Sphingobacteriales bacterium]
MSNKSFFGKVIWLTGASQGIGKALALELNSQGAKLILSARNREALYAVKSECTFNPIDVHILPLDVTDMDEIKRITQEAQRIYGKIDWLIQNAGISQRSYAEVTELKVDRTIMEVNYFGPVALTKAVLPDMIKRRSGNIAVVSSLVGKFGTPYRSSYAASKHALHGFFDSLRAETEDRGVKVTMVCPGFIATNL